MLQPVPGYAGGRTRLSGVQCFATAVCARVQAVRKHAQATTWLQHITEGTLNMSESTCDSVAVVLEVSGKDMPGVPARSRRTLSRRHQMYLARTRHASSACQHLPRRCHLAEQRAGQLGAR